MFVVQEAVAKNNAATEDMNGKLMISFVIILANAAAGGLYPLYRFVTAWAECGEIDLDFITSSIKSGAQTCLGPEVVASLLASCACLSNAKKKTDEAEAEVRRLRATAEEMRQHELVSTAEGRYNDAAEAKKQIDEARALYQDVKSGVADIHSATADLCAEARMARTCDNGQSVKEQEDVEIQAFGVTPVIGNDPSLRNDVRATGRNVHTRNHNTATAENPNARGHSAASFQNIVVPPSLVQEHGSTSSRLVYFFVPKSYGSFRIDHAVSMAPGAPPGKPRC